MCPPLAMISTAIFSKFQIAKMSNFNSSKSVILKDVRLAWADIFRPGTNDDGGPAKYKVRGIFPPDSEAKKLSVAAMLEAARGLWGDNATNVIRAMAANNKAVRNGNDNLDDKGNVRPEFAGMYFISASNKGKPMVVGPKRVTGTFDTSSGGKITVENEFLSIHEDGSCSLKGETLVKPPYKITPPYRGCRVNIKIQMIAGKAFTATKGDKKEQIPNQVYAKIEAVQFLRDDEAFGAGPSNAEGFDDEDVEGGTDTPGADTGIDEDDLF